MVTRADELARVVREGERAKRELDRLAALPDLNELEDGAVIAATLRYNRGGPAYTYVGYKERGLWYFTGKQGPNGVTSDEAAAWLAKSGRRVLNLVQIGGYTAELVEVHTVDLGAFLGGLMGAHAAPFEPGGLFGNGR